MGRRPYLIAEQGNHNELMERNEQYAELFQLSAHREFPYCGPSGATL